jgi:hypothetical protein
VKRRNWTNEQDAQRKAFWTSILAAAANREELVKLRIQVEASPHLWNEHRKTLIGKIGACIREIDNPPTESQPHVPPPWATDDAAGALEWLKHKDSEGYSDLDEEVFEVRIAVDQCDDEGFPVPSELRERLTWLEEQQSAEQSEVDLPDDAT